MISKESYLKGDRCKAIYESCKRCKYNNDCYQYKMLELIKKCVYGIIERDGLDMFEYSRVFKEVETWSQEKIMEEIEFNEYLEDK